MGKDAITIDNVRASRAGHTFHERWAARRALQLVFPKDDLFAIAVEGLSTNETVKPGDEAEDIADLTLFFGHGDTFESCRAQQTLQFKHKITSEPATSSYLKKTIQKFAATLRGYEEDFGEQKVNEKLSFSFVTNGEFSVQLWEAIQCLKEGTKPKNKPAQAQYEYLEKWCRDKGVDASRLFPLIEFRASTKDLAAQNRKLHQTLGNWTPGVDSQARMRLHGLEELIREKAGLSGQRNNLVKREDVLDSLACEPEDLFPANTEFVNVGVVIEREALFDATKAIKTAKSPVVIFADGGVGKTVFIQSLARVISEEFETVVFDCFGGGAYRSEDQSRHLPKIGLLQIVNELASRGLCDPQLPSDGDQHALIKAARKRLEQAAGTIKAQSAKHGLLVVIDAADNAQLEADRRQEDAFPRLLLASLSREPLDGVKLVLTARPHRMDSVIGKSQVERLELGPFTEDETRRFVESRRDDLTQLEFSTALARSGGNARVLEYLVESWDQNVAGAAPKEKMTVEELIGQRCGKIHRDLHLAGWSDDEVKQFFTAISLLPPPIPLKEMAGALGWTESKVNSAVADLAPMLEVLKHGAVFRDEPTETFVHETYAMETKAQQKIADRLHASQSRSTYAAEALPHFLVVINDSTRAYSLADSQAYPASIQTEYGRRRLQLLRLRAAFSLAVKEKDHDRILRLTMRLAQVASANAKGDQFIRRSPGVSVSLGDQDASRRLFQDRSGWRGERDARLTVAFAFLGEMEEAEIHQSRAIGWINWHIQNRSEGERFDRSGPSSSDFAAVVFLSILQGAHTSADSNLARWNFHFALSVCYDVIELIEQYEAITGINRLPDLTKFAASKECQSLALQTSLLVSKRSLHFANLKRLARATGTNAERSGSEAFDDRFDHERAQQGVFSEAALAALIHNSRQSASRILGAMKAERISSYDYGERFGPFRGWTPILTACVSAWSGGHELRFHHLLPRDVEVTRTVKSISKSADLLSYLSGLKKVRKEEPRKGKRTAKPENRFNRSECEKIASGSELVIALAEPLQEVILARRELVESDFHRFLENWESKLQLGLHWRAEETRDYLSKRVGFRFAQIFLQHAQSVSVGDARKLVDVLDRGRFTIEEKLNALFLLARHSNLHSLTGTFAQKVADDIRKDESIDQRSEQYSKLAEALLPMSVFEAQEYFRQGLSQLDKMGGDDYDIIYSLLRYAAEQRGGWVKPELGHRLMNLCQTICHYEPQKFGWTLFGQATAQSVGFQAAYKLIRWADQDVGEFSYGLPQLACFLATKGYLDARRAAFVLLLCENQGWYEWSVGNGLQDIFGVSSDRDRRTIFRSVFAKLEAEHPFGGSEYLWTSLLEAAEKFTGTADPFDLDLLNSLASKARTRREEENQRQNAHHDYSPSGGKAVGESEKRENEEAFDQIVASCDLASPESVDEAIRLVRKDRRFMFNAGKRIIEDLRERCPYDRRNDFLLMLAELIELDFDDTVELVKETVALWASSSSHISSNINDFIQNIFEFKGSDLFTLSYTEVLREIRRLVEFCGDAEFVLGLVFETVAKEKVELTGDEWLQLATSLCPYASNEANLWALEELLSGPAAQIGDEIGEGSYKTSFTPPEDESKMVAELTWHLLGNEDAFVRWNAARSIKGLADLGLHTDIAALLDCYDRAHIDALVTDGTVSASFLNAQQWLLMGLARACLFHGTALVYLKDRLEHLVARGDIHVVNRVHVARCLQHISARPAPEIQELWDDIYTPARGFSDRGEWPKPGKPETGFRFDYEFNKHEISRLARLFGISEGEAADAVAGEILKRWPEATDMRFFYGQERYPHSRTDRYESYRESVQKHAMLSAATTLARTKPVIRDSYEPDDARPWVEWLQEYDVSFEDGAWLSDRKDPVPEQAKQLLMVRGTEGDTLENEEEILRTIGLIGETPDSFLPLGGSWRSGDGVSVRIASALTRRKGVIGRCKAFSKRPYHDVWLPTFGSDGHVDRHMRRSEFEPLIWYPERYPIGIDVGDEFATRYAVTRPRLGVGLTGHLGLKPDNDNRNWLTQDGSLALKSQVWGQWRPDPSDHRAWFQDEGMILWAQPHWLDGVLSRLNRSLVFYVDIYRYRSRRSYDGSQSLRAVVIALRMRDGSLRRWTAKDASKMVY